MVGEEQSGDDVQSTNKKNAESGQQFVLPVLRDNSDGYQMCRTSNEHHVGNNVVMIGGDLAALGISESQGVGTGCKHLLVATAENDTFEYVGPGGFVGVTLLRTDCKDE